MKVSLDTKKRSPLSVFVSNKLEEINFKLMVLNKNLLTEPKKEEENASAKVDLC
jgi:hypothetical protein